MALTYKSYLKIDQLLSLQAPRSGGPAHDEMLFIITHQAYELWFKLILHEADHLILLLNGGELGKINQTIKRIHTVLSILVQQWDVLETMTPAEFLCFRDSLQTASGFQSRQFRELEFVFGFKRREILSGFEAGSPEYKRLADRIARPSVWDGFLSLLKQHGFSIPEKTLNPVSDVPVKPSTTIQGILKEIYRSDPGLTVICEGLVDLDGDMQKWRYHHVKMVERTIGDKKGTGGSSGAHYLRGTIFRPFFPDLWAVRSELETDG